MTTITEQLGRVLADRYRLDAGLGSGTSAHVYAAFDTRLSRRVAIKLVHPGLVDDEGFLRRLRAEARSVAALSHPNVLKVFDWGEEEDGPFLVLEYLGGGSLRALLDTGARLDYAQVAAIGLQAARGLAYAHRRGFVHRDIKPANLLFDEDGVLRIADFGLARALAEAAWTEPAGAMLGTARYASPEQAQGRPLDDRSDVYSLALALYEAVVGRVPFAADTTLATLMARVGTPLPIVPELGPLAPILGMATISDPLARLDAAELAENLELLVRQLPEATPLPLVHEQLPVLIEPWAADAMTTSSVPLAPAPPSSEGREHERLAVRPGRPPREANDDREHPPSESEPRRRHARSTPPRLYDAAEDGEYGDVDPSPVLVAPVSETDARPTRRERRSAHRPGRHRIRNTAIVLVVLALLAGGATVATRHFVDSGHKVPRLVGRSIARARADVRAADLRIVEDPSQYSSTVPAGIILSEKPAAGVSLKSDGRVTVVVSSGHAPVPVPTVVGKSGAAAVAARGAPPP
jgi:serine/threonine-protein kinase